MNSFIKQPIEKFPVSMDFDLWLVPGDTIASRTVTAKEGDIDVTADLIAGATINGTEVRAIVQGGESSKIYKLTFRITTSQANIYEEDLIMKVTEI